MQFSIRKMHEFPVFAETEKKISAESENVPAVENALVTHRQLHYCLPLIFFYNTFSLLLILLLLSSGNCINFYHEFISTG